MGFCPSGMGPRGPAWGLARSSRNRCSFCDLMRSSRVAVFLLTQLDGKEGSMARPRRFTPPDSVLHLVNRGNDQKQLFGGAREYEEFLNLVAAVKVRCPMRLLAYCLMPNHWHMVVWPEPGQSVAAFCHRLCTIHAIRHRRETGTVGFGHLYQHRYHSFAIESERQVPRGDALRRGQRREVGPGRAGRALAMVEPRRALRSGSRTAGPGPAGSTEGMGGAGQ